MKKYTRNNVPLCVVLVSIALFCRCEATCLPRNITHLYVLPSPSESSSTPAPSSNQQSPSPPQQQSTPPPQNQQSPPPPQQQSPPPSPPQQSPPPPPQQTPPPSPPPAPTATPTPPSPQQSEPSDTNAVPFSRLPPIPGLVPSAIKVTCLKLTHPEICMSSIQSLLPARDDGGNVGIPKMLELSLNALKQQTQVAGQELTKLAAKPGTDSTEATMMRGCSDRFNDAQGDLDSALEASKQTDMATVQINLSAVLDAYSGCSGGDAPGDPVAAPNSPRDMYYKKLKMFIDNSFDLSGMLK